MGIGATKETHNALPASFAYLTEETWGKTLQIPKYPKYLKTQSSLPAAGGQWPSALEQRAPFIVFW